VKDFCRMTSADWHNATPFAFLRRRTVHDYTQARSGVDYVLEAVDPEGSQIYMTAQGRNVAPGHIIAIATEQQPWYYQVETIDYYADPADMWVALLSKCPTTPT
jgi:hypothetical protein